MGDSRQLLGARAPRAGLGLLAALAAWILAAPQPAPAAVREHWLAAVPVHWEIAPNHRDAIERKRIEPQRSLIWTVAYREYTRNWGRRLDRGRGAHELGVIGPLIRGRVGDRFVIHFKNKDVRFKRPHSLHVHGVRYRFGSDGSFIPGFSGKGGNVEPGESYTYRFEALPTSVGIWPYHDHSMSMMASITGGMYGAFSILGRSERRPDREFVSFFGGVGGFATINGRAFVGNTPVFHARVGERVQWDVLALGDEHHTFHVHGHRWIGAGGVPEDTRNVGPAESFRVRWREDVPGTWLYHCHVEQHMMDGMIGIYRVRR